MCSSLEFNRILSAFSVHAEGFNNALIFFSLSCFCRKNGCSAVNRMNGVMAPGSTSAFTERLC